MGGTVTFYSLKLLTDINTMNAAVCFTASVNCVSVQCTMSTAVYTRMIKN